MSAVFGIDEHETTFSPDHRTVYMRRSAVDGTDVLRALRQVFPEDIVFLKHYTPQGGLDVTAIGVVQPCHPRGGHEIACVPVRWVWEGNCHIENPEEVNSLRSRALYEEYDIEVQRELLELMPEDCRMAPEW